MRKYEGIIHDIRSRINQGDLEVGAKLPTVKELMSHYQVSKATVLRSMQELVNQELIYVKDRSGYFVLANKQVSKKNEAFVFDFSSRGVIQRDFPFADFQKCLTQVISQHRDDIARYGDPKGLVALVNVIVTLLVDYGVYTKGANVFITSGIQEALYILSQISFPNAKQTILVEQPSYDTYLRSLKLISQDVIGIKRDFTGLDMTELERLFKEKDIKFFYLMPRIHNPLGTTLPQWQLKKIVELAEHYDVYLVEDDYLADYVVGATQLPLHYYDVADRVIYLKSFSKIVFPGLRVGAVVLPTKLQPAFSQYKEIVNISTDVIMQHALTLYINNGMFGRNRELLAKKVRAKSETLNRSLQQHLTTLHQTRAVGIHSTIELPINVTKQSLLKKLEEQGIVVDDLEACYLESEQNQLIKLNVTQVSSNKIDEGVVKIARIISDIANRRRKNRA